MFLLSCYGSAHARKMEPERGVRYRGACPDPGVEAPGETCTRSTNDEYTRTAGIVSCKFNYAHVHTHNPNKAIAPAHAFQMLIPNI